MSHNNIGHLQRRLGKTDAALKAFQDSLAIRQTLTKLDPSNTEFQRDLSVSYEIIGDLQLRLGNTDNASKAYQDSLAIRQTLTKLDPSNTEFQRDLSVSHNNIGYLQLRLGNANAALKAYQDSLAIRQTLIKLDPSNTKFQRDLCASYSKLYDGYKAKNDFATAKTQLETALQLIKEMQKKGTLPKDDEQYIKPWEAELLNISKLIKP